jgi:hypothetical protein
MIPTIVIIAFSTTALVLVLRILHVISQHVAHYLPATSNAKLSKDLMANLTISASLLETSQRQAVALQGLLEELEAELSIAKLVRESIQTQSSQITTEWLVTHGPEFYSDILRGVRDRLSTHLEMELIDRTTKLAGEYVLLQPLDALELNVKLEARYQKPEAIRNALCKLLTWNPPKGRKIQSDNDLASWFLEQTKSREKLDLLLGSLGRELFDMQWTGAIAAQCKQKEAA